MLKTNRKHGKEFVAYRKERLQLREMFRSALVNQGQDPLKTLLLLERYNLLNV